jgi:hypothetical protein
LIRLPPNAIDSYKCTPVYSNEVFRLAPGEEAARQQLAVDTYDVLTAIGVHATMLKPIYDYADYWPERWPPLLDQLLERLEKELPRPAGAKSAPRVV